MFFRASVGPRPEVETMTLSGRQGKNTSNQKGCLPCDAALDRLFISPHHGHALHSSGADGRRFRVGRSHKVALGSLQSHRRRPRLDCKEFSVRGG